MFALIKQRIVSANTTSVHQGSFLDPLLLLVYINDIVIRCNIILFADDTSTYIVVENATSAAASISLDIDSIRNWSISWFNSFVQPSENRNCSANTS